MTGDWGKDIARLLALSEQNADLLDTRLSELGKQIEKDKQQPQDLIMEMQA